MNRLRARVLVVDDFEQWRRLVRAALEKEGLHVIGEAADGPEALRKTEELQPDLIVLDISLPKLNGIEVARKTKMYAPKSKVVIFTQNDSSDFADAAFREGASGYVLKSAMRELIPTVKAVLQGEQSSSFAGALKFGTETA